MQIIPAIDIIDGKCVRLTEGDYSKKTVYNEDPLEVALMFEANGIRRLHLVDLDGAKAGRIINYKTLESIASKTKMIIDFGGGIKTEKDLETVYSHGAMLATIGSLAVKEPELFFSWVKKYGSDKIFLGADVKNEKIAINGWLESTELNIYDFVKKNIEKGVTNIFCTDISKDGKMEGPSLELYKKMIELNPELKLTASGGVSCYEDIVQLKNINCSGVIVGKAIYEDKISLKQIEKFNK